MSREGKRLEEREKVSVKNGQIKAWTNNPCINQNYGYGAIDENITQLSLLRSGRFIVLKTAGLCTLSIPFISIYMYHVTIPSVVTVIADMRKGADVRTLTAEILWKLPTPSN